MLAGVGVLALLSLGLDFARFRIAGLNRLFLRWLAPLLKHDEDRKVTGASYMLVAAFIAFLVFDQPVSVLAMFFLAVGDPVAALVGARTPGPRWAGKSPGGTAAFVGVSAVVVLVLNLAGGVDYHWAMLVGGLVAALVEQAPLPVDDNLTIPLVSGVAMQLLGASGVG